MPAMTFGDIMDLITPKHSQQTRFFACFRPETRQSSGDIRFNGQTVIDRVADVLRVRSDAIAKFKGRDQEQRVNQQVNLSSNRNLRQE